MDSRIIVMSATNQNQKTEPDSLRVTETGEGKFEIEWDPNDPRWSWMNDLTEEELQTMMTQAIQISLAQYDS